MNNRFHIETFGCQMNKNDSEFMELSLKEEGFVPGVSAEDSDIVIFNTCSVRQHAEDRVLARIYSVKKKIHDRNGLVIIAGCMAQRLGKDLITEGASDMVIGPYQSPDIGRLVRMRTGSGDSLFISQDRADFHERINIRLAAQKDALPWRRWVTVTHGCENFCSYCIVPHVRGKLISFPSDSIIPYMKALALSGVTEVTLLGQNVNQYGTDCGDVPFYKLLEQTASIPGFLRINFLTSHPMDFSGDIIRVIAGHENISRSIHLPLQSGSDRILGLMNRKYTRGHYMDIIDAIDRLLDDYSITTDLIVGFPGEKPEDYNETLSAVKQIRFDDAFMYAYSPREGTPAAELTEDLTRKEKIDRLQGLITIQKAISREKLAARTGGIETVIIERLSKKSGEKVMGKTGLNHPVVCGGSPGDIGRLVRVRIDGVSGSTLTGARIE